MANQNSSGNTRVKVENIRNNMILARDIVTEDGIMLLAAGAPLNNVSITKLRSLGIDSIIIQGDSQFQEPIPPVEVKKMIPIVKRVEFLEFEQEYESRTAEYELYVKDIGEGKDVDVADIYKISGDILDSLQFPSDAFTFLYKIKQSDVHTFTHCVNVSVLCHIFGIWLKLPKKDLIDLTVAGMLHDIGKTKVPSEYLNKKEKLTDDEWLKIKSHAAEGYQILRDQQKVSYEIKMAVLMHHEKMDGTGYPMGIQQDRIMKFAKIVAICDIYDALTTDRSYHEKKNPFQVMRIMETGLYTELDINYLLIFLKNIAYNYLGTWVQLSDGRVGEIVFINKNVLSKPIVRTETGEMIDISTNEDLSIVELL